jgi:hypothetical protein
MRRRSAIAVCVLLLGLLTTESKWVPHAIPAPPSSEWFPNAVYACDKGIFIAPYLIRHWKDSTPSGLPLSGIATIDKGAKRLLLVDFATSLDDLSGTDITGEGNPDVIIETYSGGAHCCSATFVYDLGPTLAKVDVLSSPNGNSCGSFQDLDGDGVYEFVDADDSFAYRYCAFAVSPAVRVILKYEPGVGYVPASPEFAHLYAGDIARHTRWAECADEGAAREGWDDTPKCAVLPLVLDYLYSGQIEKAWGALSHYYTFPDVESFRADIWAVVSQSPYFALPKAQAILADDARHFVGSCPVLCAKERFLSHLQWEGRAPLDRRWRGRDQAVAVDR